MSSRHVTSRVREIVWNGSIPLEIRLHKEDCRTYDESDAYLIQFSRLSYLGLLLQPLHNFFCSSLIYPDISPSEAWLEYEGVPLKWHYPLGLLYDLYSSAEPHFPHASIPSPSPQDNDSEDERTPQTLPWKLTLHFSSYPTSTLIKLDPTTGHKILHDLFIHSVKEADYLRNGTGRTVMFLSEKDSGTLWDSVVEHSFEKFNYVNQKLLNPQGVNLRHIPVRLYLPHKGMGTVEEEGNGSVVAERGSVRVVQGLITPAVSSRQPQTIGTALNQIIPSLFPSRRSPLLAQAVLHGAVLPLGAAVEELLRTGAYLDGWLHVVVAMM